MVDWKKITRQHKVHTDLRRGWLVSYLVIFCVPLAAYLLISAVTLGIIRNQTYDLNEQALHVISVAVDHQVQSVEEMATEISANTILNEILSMEQETAQHEWRLYELQNELISMVSRNSMIEQIYIYFYDGNYLLSDTTKAKPAYFYENQCSGLVMNEKEWENILRTPHLKEYQIWENGSIRPIPMLLLSLPLFDGAPKATICIQLAPQKFWQVVESNEDMAMAIYDGQERQLYLESYETEASPVVLQSSATGWRYEGYIEDAVLEAQEGYVQVMNVWGVFLVLLVGGAAIWIFIRRNYNPIRSIIARFEQISDRKEKEVGEYSFIENALNQLILRVQENREEIQEQLTKHQGGDGRGLDGADPVHLSIFAEVFCRGDYDRISQGIKPDEIRKGRCKMPTMSHHLHRMKEYELLRSSVNTRTPFSFPRHSIKALRFHSP